MEDLDFERSLLVIRQTKFGKSRLVPFGPRTEELLRGYLKTRATKHGTPRPEDPLFTFGHGRPVHPGTISQTFHLLVPHLEMQILRGASPPRAHDLRHTFAVGTLLRWYRSGVDPGARLLHLSTFLGHVDPDSTAVYLTITPDLLEEANHRFEQFAASAVKEDFQQ
jgi:integrase